MSAARIRSCSSYGGRDGGIESVIACPSSREWDAEYGMKLITTDLISIFRVEASRIRIRIAHMTRPSLPMCR